MNSIKNAIVTVTLLTVGYGAYVVLNTPTQQESQQLTAQQGVPDGASLVGEPMVAPVHPPPATQTDAALLSPQVDLLAMPIQEPVARVATPTSPPPLVPPNSFQPRDVAHDHEAVPHLPEVSSRQLELPALESPASEPRSSLPVLPPTFEPPAATNLAPVPSADESRFGSAEIELPEVDMAPLTPHVADNESRFIPGVTEPSGFEDPTTEATSHQPPPIDNSLGPIPSSSGSVEFERVWQTTQQKIRDQDLVQALVSLSPWHSDRSLTDEQAARCRHLLDQLSGSVIYSRHHLLEPEYRVQAGETLDEIASRYGVPQELLAKINGISPPFALGTGESLKVVRGPFRAEIDITRGELILLLGSSYAGRFPVKIGRDLPAQEAFYRVAEKNDGRSYFDRRSGVEVLKGADSNRYGGHWIGLRGEQITSGHSVGIHGRPNFLHEDDIGSVSLDPIDADDVFSILSVGSRIQIRR